VHYRIVVNTGSVLDIMSNVRSLPPVLPLSSAGRLSVANRGDHPATVGRQLALELLDLPLDFLESSSQRGRTRRFASCQRLSNRLDFPLHAIDTAGVVIAHGAANAQ
jgi:hypothetical protein